MCDCVHTHVFMSVKFVLSIFLMGGQGVLWLATLLKLPFPTLSSTAPCSPGLPPPAPLLPWLI